MSDYTRIFTGGEKNGLYVVHEESFATRVALETRMLGLGPWPVFESYPVLNAVLRDANATAGTWPEVIRLEHVPVVFDPIAPSCWEDSDGDDDVGELLVPLFVGDPERAVWRRRKWWGRGPIKPLGGCWNPWPASRVCMEALPCVWPRCKPFREEVVPVDWRN